MAVQFAGSSSTGDRRRRRLAVNGDGADVDPSLLEGGGNDVESRLVSSAAAGPWVPFSEMRIRIYAAVASVVLGGLAFVHVQPISFWPGLTPIADHLFAGQRPTLLVAVETIFLALSAQLGSLIGWYRSRGRLDFAGRYRIWWWASTLFGIAAFCGATNVHQPLGEVVRQSAILEWRGHIVAWLLPVCMIALPVTLLVDRDMRNSRSSLFTFRISVGLWLACAWLEIYQTELAGSATGVIVRQLLPIFASATLFFSLWHHTRIVAYVCPDPPELNEPSAWSLILAAGNWIGKRLVFRRANSETESDDEDAKPKRRRKKVEEKVEDEESATKRKRKAPARKTTTRTRTRVKSTEEETEDSQEESTTDESASTQGSHESADDASYQETSNSSSNDYQQEEEEPWQPQPVSKPVRLTTSKSTNDGRVTQIHQSHESSVPAPHSRRQPKVVEEPYAAEEQSSYQSNDSSDDDEDSNQFDARDGVTAEQLKGLSKRQKRELRKQMREQERTKGR